MAFNRARLNTRRAPSTRDVAFQESVRVRYLFQACHRAVMQLVASIPQAPKRRDLVVAGSLPRRQRQTRIGPDRYPENVQSCRRVLGRREALREGQLVARVQRRSVTRRATLPREDLLS